MGVRVGMLVFAFGGILVMGQEDEQRVRTSAAVQNYTVSFFSDEGFPRVRVEGGSADLTNRNQIKLTDLHLELFTGGADRTLETKLDAASAVLDPTNEIVSGPDGFRLERDDIEVTGEDWTYSHRDRRVQVKRNARVVFKMPLEGLLE